MSVLLFIGGAFSVVVSLLCFWLAILRTREPGRLPWWSSFQNAMLLFFSGLGEVCFAVTRHHRAEVIAVALLGVSIGVGLASLTAQVPLILADRGQKPRQTADKVNRAA